MKHWAFNNNMNETFSNCLWKGEIQHRFQWQQSNEYLKNYFFACFFGLFVADHRATVVISWHFQALRPLIHHVQNEMVETGSVSVLELIKLLMKKL